MTQQQQTFSQKDVLGSGKAARAAFGKGHGRGDVVEGEILSIDARQQWSFPAKNRPSEPMWWDEAKTQPKVQLIVTLQTDLDEDAEDDGVRAVYAPKAKTMARALTKAVRDAGADELEVGGKLKVACTGKLDEDDEYSPRGYVAEYRAPRKAKAAQEAVLGAFGITADDEKRTTASEPVRRRAVVDEGDALEEKPAARRRVVADDDELLRAAGVTA